MKITTLSLASGFVFLGVLASTINCGDDDATSNTPARLARKGEACQTTNDCTAGLACLPQSGGSGGVCVLGVFSVAQTAKECAVIECQAASDCCPDPLPICASLKTSCDSQRDAGTPNPTTCDEYTQQCVCNPQLDCENGQCVTKCVNDSTCTIVSGSAGKCLGGVCGDCSSDDDCKDSSKPLCVSGKCQAKCQGDGDCAGFDRCVGGKCVEGGCQTDRECVAASRNVEATCGTDGKCIVPCQTDLECGNPKDYTFYSCVSGQCLYMGCGTDKDCSLLLFGDSDLGTTTTTGGTSSGSGGSSGSTTSALSSKQHVVCRDKTTPNPTTKPAQ